MWYMLNVYLRSDVIIGDFSVNVARLLGAVALHVMIMPESFQGISLIKFSLASKQRQGRKRQFLIGFFQAFTSFGTEVLNLLFMCTQSEITDIVANNLVLTFIINIDDMISSI